MCNYTTKLVKALTIFGVVNDRLSQDECCVTNFLWGGMGVLLLSWLLGGGGLGVVNGGGQSSSLQFAQGGEW